jgi:hypothetical protein
MIAMEVFDNPISCILIGFVAGVAICYTLGIIQFDMRIRASHPKKTFTVRQDDVFSREEKQNIEFMRHLVRTGQVTEDIR